MDSRPASGVDVDDEEVWRKMCSKHEELRRKWSRRAIDNRFIRRYGDMCLGPRCFYISSQVHEMIYGRQMDRFGNLDDSTSDTFLDTLKCLLEAQEVYESILMHKYDVIGQRLTITSNEGQVSYSIELTNLSYYKPKCWKHDFVVLDHESRRLSVILRIKEIRGDHIELRTPRTFPWHLKCMLQEPLNIRIVPSGLPFLSQHKAIEVFKGDLRLRKMIFEDLGEPNDEVKIDVAQTSTPELEARLEKLDGNQRRAVAGILEARCRPKPYILFGPPGTGKSRTLIEAVVQIYRRSTGKHGCSYEEAEPSILVCSFSNNSVDELHDRLRRELPQLPVQRLEAGSTFSSPRSCGIMLSTNVRAGQLIGVKQFDYVLVDDAGEADTAVSLVPTCLVKLGGCLVLCEDIEQLSPAHIQDILDRKLDNSLLQRLAKFNIYQRDPATSSYNGDYVTALSDCYRCDARVLAPAHRKFGYDNLRYANRTPEDLLQRLGLSKPIQIMDVRGEEGTPEGASTKHNMAEAEACVDLVVRFIESGVRLEQIGITSFYRSQVHVIKGLLEEALVERLESISDCKIDTVGTFRGSERDIIIMSTVHAEAPDEDEIESHEDATWSDPLRSRMDFVSLSRARWLFVVVGSRESLEHRWPELLPDAGGEL